MQPIPRRILLFFLLLLGLGWIVISRADSHETNSLVPAPQVGFLAPDFTLETSDDLSVTLSELHGQPVLINFWASWCPPCRAEMPAIQKVFADYSGRGLIVLAINATNQDALANIRPFIAEYQLTFTIPLDTNGTINALYEVHSLPTTFFIKPDGVIHKIVIGGPMTEVSLRLQIESLLEKLP